MTVCVEESLQRKDSRVPVTGQDPGRVGLCSCEGRRLPPPWTPGRLPHWAPRPTCQYFVVRLPAVGHLSMGEHLPHQHAEGPDIRLGGEVTLQDGLGGHPAQGHPGLAEVVVLAVERTTRGHEGRALLLRVEDLAQVWGAAGAKT